jgi:putative ABC transport system permease protein
MRRTRITQNVWLGVENLLLHKLRSFLTMLGVVFGVGSVMAMLSVGEGASRDALAQIQKLGTNNILISSMKAAEDEQTSNEHTHLSIYGLTYDDCQRIGDGFDSIRRIAPAKLMRKEARLYEQALELRVVATTPDWFQLVPRPVLAGRVLLPSDQEDLSPVAVLTEFGARKILAGQNTIGQTIRIGSDGFKIIGIVQSEGSQAGNIQIPDQQVDVYIPIEVARRYYGDIEARRSSGSFERTKVELHQIIVQVSDADCVESTAKGIEHVLSRFHKKKDYALSVPLALIKQAQATKRTFNIVLGSIAGISLLVGGIGIMNIMMASVTERTREIGIRRALGAKRKQIIYQFLIETIVLSTLGGIIGLCVGGLIPLLITYFSGMATVVTFSGVLVPLVISIMTGVVFGLYPAMNAARVDPIIALRHE